MIRDPGIASIPVEEKWIDEAVEELAGYNSQPFLSPFMQQWGLNPDGSRGLAEKIAEIRRCILDPRHALRLDDLAAYLDGLKLNGRQLIYLWRIKDEEKGYLATLASRSEHHDLVWRAESPVLAEVRHLDSWICFKWVCTRDYFIEMPGTPPAFAPRRQRTVSFFFVDLASGDAELRIQSLPDGNGLPSHAAEFDRYRDEAAKVIELNRFVPVEIEPVANQWLRRAPRGLLMTSWSVERSDGTNLHGGGRHADSFAMKLEMFGQHFVKKATFRWDCSQRSTRHALYFTLDGAGNAVDFNGRADASRIAFLLDLIRHDPRRKPVVNPTDPRSFVARAEEAAKRRGRPRLRKAVKPVAWTLTAAAAYVYPTLASKLVDLLVDQASSWLGSQIEEALGEWALLFKILLVVLAATLHFLKVFGIRIWQPVHVFAASGVKLLDLENVKGVLEHAFRQWALTNPRG